MGCGVSKADDSPLVKLCKERKEYVKTALEFRYALAAAHVTYFHSLLAVGDAIRKFVEEEIIAADSSPQDSPVLTLPSKDFNSKSSSKHNRNHTHDSSSSSISHSIEENTSRNVKSEKELSDAEDSHLHLSSGSASISNSNSGSPSSVSHQNWGYSYPPQGNLENPNFSPGNPTPYFYYMKKSAAPSRTFVYQEPDRYSSAYRYSGYPPNPNGGGLSGHPVGNYGVVRRNSPPDQTPPPPSPPPVSTWDFLNVFDADYYSPSKYWYGSSIGTPDYNEVKLREEIPELEDEKEEEPEMLKRTWNKQKKKMDEEMSNSNFGEGTSMTMQIQNNQSKELSTSNSKLTSTSKLKEVVESPHTGSGHIEFESSSGNSSEEETSVKEVESSKPSSMTTLSVHGVRDLREVVQEIRDEFETASGYGKEVALLLEVDKLPYQRRVTGFRVIFSRVLHLMAPNVSSSHPLPGSTVSLSSRTMEMAKDCCEQDRGTRQENMSSTLEKIYAWEKKLYKEVQEEEWLRVIYEKKCVQLRTLDGQGAESNKIDSTRASVRKLLTKIDVCVKAVETISSRIHYIRDEELQPLITELIYGLTKMWKSMVRCHHKQFQAIMESKLDHLRANTGFQRDSGLKATRELERELLAWSSQFTTWIRTQKAYAKCLNEWLSRCLIPEQEVTDDGPAPFSPSRVGAPRIFIICNDWSQAMNRISEEDVANAIKKFATSLHELWERQDEEQRLRTRAQNLSKGFEKQLKNLHMERERVKHDQNALSEKSEVSKEVSVSKLEDLKVNLDSMRKKLEEERTRHKVAVKLVHDAASNSLHTGLVPIFEALSNFSSEVLKAHEQVRLQNTRNS